MKLFSYRIATQGTFRRQIILTFVVGAFLLISGFAVYIVNNETTHLYRDSSEDTISLASSLAVSSQHWVLANDLAGLEEIAQSFRLHPQLSYAMIISPSGRVLAHTEKAKVGQYLSDAASLAMLKSAPARRVMINDATLMDVAAPIMVQGRCVGWARVAQSRENAISNLRNMMMGSVFFVLLSTALALLAAILIANRLGGRIGSLVRVAKEVQAGNFAVRANVAESADEIASLGGSFNQMLDELVRSARELRAASHYTRSLIEASLDPLVTISAEGKITDVNEATEKATGRSRAELTGTDFSDYFTAPDKARAGYQQVFSQGYVTDYPLALRHRDGRVMDVLYNASVYRDEGGKVLGVFAAARDVTERKRAEEELRRSEHSLAEAQRIAHLGNWELDIVRNVLTWSDEIFRIFEIDSGKFGASYEAFLDAVHPDDREMVNRAYTESLASKTPYNIVHRLLMKDGRIKYVNEKCETHYGADGKPLLSIGTLHDITERKLAEEKLREKEERLTLATLHNGIGIWDWNLLTQKLFWDDSMYALYHIRREDFSGTEEAWRSSLHPDDLGRGDREVEDAIAGIRPFNTEFRVVWPGGEIRHIRAVAKVFRDAQGTPLRMLGINMDITDRKQMEDALKEREEFLSLIIENIPDMIFMKEAKELRFVRFNKAGEELLGYRREDLLGKNDYDFFPREQADSFTQKDREVLEGGRLYDIPEEPLDSKFGKRILHTKKLPILDAQGKPAYLLGISEDITERKQTEIQIRELNRDLEQRVIERTAQLEAANKELEAFSYSVSHDLRTPLRAIDGFSKILLDEYTSMLDDEGKRLLNVVRDNTARMGQLIEDILQFSRTGRLELAYSEVDMDTLAREALAELQPPVASGKLLVEIDPLPPARGDRAMLHQVFINLLSNAIKFSRDRAPAKIMVGSAVRGDEAIYYVRDNGVGFDMRYADKLFGVFQRLHSVSEFEGTGIGLAIVKRIITRHGGRVWAEGKVNEGATVYFALAALKETGHE